MLTSALGAMNSGEWQQRQIEPAPFVKKIQVSKKNLWQSLGDAEGL